MRLTQFSDNALRCLLALGLQPDQVVSINIIAVQMGMSHEHLMKVVHRLHDLGYVETRRGRHGGVRLLKAPADIVLGTVIRQTEDIWTWLNASIVRHLVVPLRRPASWPA